MTEFEERLLEQVTAGASALQVIAAVLVQFQPAGEEPCAHPADQRALHPESTMTSVRYVCTACHAEVA